MDWFIQVANNHPTLGYLWFFWVTFHDLFQWGAMGVLGFTAFGLRKKAQEETTRREEVEHIHAELHNHITEDAGLHEQLGQENGLTEGS